MRNALCAVCLRAAMVHEGLRGEQLLRIVLRVDSVRLRLRCVAIARALVHLRRRRRNVSPPHLFPLVVLFLVFLIFLLLDELRQAAVDRRHEALLLLLAEQLADVLEVLLLALELDAAEGLKHRRHAKVREAELPEPLLLRLVARKVERALPALEDLGFDAHLAFRLIFEEEPPRLLNPVAHDHAEPEDRDNDARANKQ
ncbi:hypothetical protein PybrP1_007517 [[Pythium] brassicae (nom. inval.)]|nr:hypothetical protein PybrP1_007517 [[Pythium] brassicae (nom. inval.)]